MCGSGGGGPEGRRWGLLSLLTLLMGAQVAFHVAFTDMGHPMASGHGSMSASMAHAGTAGHSLFSILAAGHPGTVMVLAHVTAALVTALLLRRGEDWCWALVQLLVGPVVMLRVDGAPLTPRRYAVAPRLSRSEQRLLLVDCASRRGPSPRLA